MNYICQNILERFIYCVTSSRNYYLDETYTWENSSELKDEALQLYKEVSDLKNKIEAFAFKCNLKLN